MFCKGVGAESDYTMIGIDVSKDTLACAFRDRHTGDLVWEETVPNTLAGVVSLSKRTPESAPWVIEPTGRYSLLVVREAMRLGRSALLAPPRQAKLFLQSLQLRAKTDRLDAKGLAQFGLSRPLRPYPIKSDAVDELDQLLAARKGVSLALSALKQRHQELPRAQQALQPSLDALTAELRALDRKIADQVQVSDEFKACSELRKIPGVGPVTAAAVTARLAAKKFSHPDKFVAYIGLDINIIQSGKRKGELGLTRQGDAELRRLLFLCAQASLRGKQSPFREQYERETNKGLSKTAAIVAVARKIAKVCWSLHYHGSTYNAQRVYTQPAKAAAEADESEDSQTTSQTT